VRHPESKAYRPPFLCHDGRDLSQDFGPKRLYFDGQPTPLIIIESHSPAADLSSWTAEGPSVMRHNPLTQNEVLFVWKLSETAGIG
jgi:hypothetical protein